MNYDVKIAMFGHEPTNCGSGSKRATYYTPQRPSDLHGQIERLTHGYSLSQSGHIARGAYAPRVDVTRGLVAVADNNHVLPLYNMFELVFMCIRKLKQKHFSISWFNSKLNQAYEITELPIPWPTSFQFYCSATKD
jgi:hypothetical protein